MKNEVIIEILMNIMQSICMMYFEMHSRELSNVFVEI